jgi:hypothetical protein
MARPLLGLGRLASGITSAGYARLSEAGDIRGSRTKARDHQTKTDQRVQAVFFKWK